ncbi:MAG: hypothetical protein WD851_12135 [Pirellulales bacterium]
MAARLFHVCAKIRGTRSMILPPRKTRRRMALRVFCEMAAEGWPRSPLEQVWIDLGYMAPVV